MQASVRLPQEGLDGSETKGAPFCLLGLRRQPPLRFRCGRRTTRDGPEMVNPLHPEGVAGLLPSQLVSEQGNLHGNGRLVVELANVVSEWRAVWLSSMTIDD
jgi:hypothetical protein